jgi:hypothetical protein
MSDIFISYAKEDRECIPPLVYALERRGWTVFWDRTIPTGKTWRKVIETEIDQARCIIVLWSVTSVDSHWVEEEAEEAKRRRILVPVRIHDVLPPFGFRSFQTGNLLGWNGDPDAFSLQALMNDIATTLSDASLPDERRTSWPESSGSVTPPIPSRVPPSGLAPPSAYVGTGYDEDDHDIGGGFWWWCGRAVRGLVTLLWFALEITLKVTWFLLEHLVTLLLVLGRFFLHKGRRLFWLSMPFYLLLTIGLLDAGSESGPITRLMFVFNSILLVVVGVLAGFGKTALSTVCAAGSIIQLATLIVSLFEPTRGSAGAALSLASLGTLIALYLAYRRAELREFAQERA